MPERRGGACSAGIADEDVELAMALMQRRAKPGDAVEVGEVERHQRRAAAVLSDLVVELFETALRSRHRNHMRAGFRERARCRIADAARCAGDESDTGGEGRGHRNSSLRHARPCAGHPRLCGRVLLTWIAGTSPAMTKFIKSSHAVIPGWFEGPGPEYQRY